MAAPSTARGLSDHNDKHHDSKGEVKSSNTSAKSNPSSPERPRSNSFDSRKFEMHKEELVLNLKNSSSSSNINGVSSKAVGQEALNFSNNRIRFGINGSLLSDSNPHSDVDSLAYSRANSTIEPKEVDYLHLIDSVVVDESGCSSNTHESSIKREKLSSNNDFNNISSSSSHSLVEGANNGAANQPTAASNSWSPTNGMEEGAVAGVRSFSKHRSQSDFSTYSIVEDSLLADISDGLNVIHKNVVSTNNINKFMLMTINRCIDYTKASKGIPLIPKLEVLSTNELYKLVTSSIHCMQDMQTRVSINYHLDLHNIDTENATLGFRNKSVAALLGHSNNINNCVNTEGNLYGNEKTNGNNLGELYSNEKYVKDTTCRTDKQWLQDNLLCLLSNAVKYSLRGRVELAVFVVSEKEKNALLSLSVQSDADNLCDEADSEEERESNALLDGTYSLMPYSRDGVNVPDYDSQSDNVTIPTEMCSPHVGSKRTRERLSHSSSGSLATDYYPDILNAEHRNLAGSSDSFTKEEHDNLRIDSDDWRPDLEGQQARYSPVSSAMSESSSGSILQKFVSWTMGNSSSYASPRENTMPDPWSQSEGGIAMEPGQGMAVRQKPKPVNLLPPKRKLIPLKSSQAMLSGVEEHQLKEKKVKINDEKDMFLGSLLDEKIHPHSTRTLRIEVADSGRLLPESILSTIFSPSKQAERGEAQGGTGIGLFSLAVRVESLGGAYGAFPRKDGQAGTVFWFEIPLYSTSYNYFFRSHNNMNNQSNRKLIRSRPSSIRNNNMVASKSGSGSSKSYYSSQVDYTNTTGSASVSLSKQNSPSPQFLDADTSNGDDKVFGVSDSCFTKSSKNASMSVNAFVSGNHSTKAEATNGSAFAPSAIGNSDASEKEKAEVSLFESEGNHNDESDKNVGEECLFPSHGNMNDALNFARIGADTAKTYRSSFNCHVTPNNTRSPPSTRGKRRSSVGAPVTRERYESTRKSGAERKLRILFVDDSLPILKMISLMLSRQGHTVEQAENGQIAVDLVARRQSDAGGETLSRVNFYDVILMDLQMPVLDGIGAIQKIREMECDKVIHSEENSAQRDIDNLFDHNNFHNFIIAVSANSDSQTSANALAAGANHFLAKPFTLDAFDELVNSHFKKSIPDSNSCSAHSRDSLKGSLANGQSSDSEGTSMKTRVCEGEGILQQIGTSIVPDQEQKLSKSDHCRNARNSKVKANKIQNSRPDIHERLADEEAKTVVLASSSLM